MSNNNLEIKKTTIEDVLSRWNDVLHAVTNVAIRNRKVTIILVFSFIIDILLTLFIGFGAIHLHDINSQAQLIACHSANSFRISEKTLWEHVLAITTPRHPTPAQLKVLYSFQHYLNKTMALRNCAGL